jgi:hypothetical protein
VRSLYAAMKAQGWVLVQSSNHPKAIGPNGEEVVLSGSPSTGGYVDSVVRKLRRYGFRWQS